MLVDKKTKLQVNKIKYKRVRDCFTKQHTKTLELTLEKMKKITIFYIISMNKRIKKNVHQL